ncbi:Inner membrane protein yqiK [Escherichia coli]|uniref:Inner membrane protein yqiK n=1 Tax=Escherichia coli TaxID=562 RepID=A0A376LCW5_ECOLX|nr:Inner membrane protein yqiK [Escherichia coli]
MDDIVNSVPSWMFTAIIAVCILFYYWNYFRQALSSRFGRASFCSYWFRWGKKW